jgi:outer membrane protein insertion porin family
MSTNKVKFAYLEKVIMYKKLYLKKMCLVFSLSILPILCSNSQTEKPTEKKESIPLIKKIIVSGNKHVKKEVILNRLPYKVGEEFDELRSETAISNLYTLGYFRQIHLEVDELENNEIELHVIVEEKKLLERIDFKGNKTIKSKKIKEELSLDKLTTIDEENLKRIADAIKKMYAKENYHKTEVEFEIIKNEETPDKATALFKIKEGAKSAVVRVYFKGNENISDRKLRNIIFTRENWLLSFLDSAGQYEEEGLEMDKHRIEYFYKDHGYLMATVADAQVEFLANNKKINVTFHIKEGERFFVRSIKAMGDELFKEEDLLHYITLEEDKPYSQSKLVESINNLKDLWGEKGYIYADVYPQIKPNEETKEVDVAFHVEKGKKLYVNRIIITGNEVTRDKIIRRQIELFEGDLITTKKLNRSQNNVEYLSFFERGSVNWKIHRLSNELANLELHVKETKTGNFQAGMTYGTDKGTSTASLKGSVMVEKKNLLGYGWDTGLMVQGDRHGIKKLQTHFFDPNIFDTNISGGISLYRKWEEYEQWKSVNQTPKETTTGGALRLGFLLPQIDKRLQLILELGIEDIRYKTQPQTTNDILKPIVTRTFQAGTLSWIGIDLIKDIRNHQVYPNRGYKLMLNTKTAPPITNDEFSFFKAEVDGSWYTPLIDEDNLVLALHAKAGTVHSLGGINNKTHKGKVIPYKELFHMGGQNTVRGFVWGSIGPAWITNDPLGARHAVQFNAELIFPLVPDQGMKGHFFYDAGAGWNTPKDDIPSKSYLKRDDFNLRHSVGFGLNLTKPMPAKIDWGYKLDRDKKAGESPHEFHLSMNYAW